MISKQESTIRRFKEFSQWPIRKLTLIAVLSFNEFLQHLRISDKTLKIFSDHVASLCYKEDIISWDSGFEEKEISFGSGDEIPESIINKVSLSDREDFEHLVELLYSIPRNDICRADSTESAADAVEMLEILERRAIDTSFVNKLESVDFGNEHWGEPIKECDLKYMLYFGYGNI